MTAPELLRTLRDAGAEVRVIKRRLMGRNIPPDLLPELRLRKADVIREIDGENYRRLARKFNLKGAEKLLRELEKTGARWRTPTAECPQPPVPKPSWTEIYPVQVHHEGEHLWVSGSLGQYCQLCYPNRRDGGGIQ